MKKPAIRQSLSIVFFLAVVCLGAIRSSATTLYFDPNGPAAGYGTGGSWDSTNWASASGGTSATANWASGDFAEFLTAASSTVTVSASESMAGLYNTISGATLTINQGSSSGNLSVTTTGGTPISGIGSVQGFLTFGPIVFNCPIVGSGGIEPEYEGTGGALYLNTNNTYSGGTYEQSSSTLINFDNNNSFGTGGIALNFNGSSFAPLLAYGGQALTLPNNWINIGTGGGVNFAGSASTPLVCNGTWNLGTTNLQIRNNGPATSPLTLNGVISSGSASGQVQFAGGGSGAAITTITAVNTYTTSTTITNTATGGITLVIGGAGQLASGSYSGLITNSGTALVYSSSANQTLSGVISGIGALSQFGSGTLTLSGANTYTGGTSNGVGSTLTIGGAGIIAATGKITNNGTFNYGSSASETISGAISGTGTLNVNGTGTLSLSGTDTYSGNTTVSSSALVGVVGGSISNSVVTVAAGATNGISINNNANQWSCAALTFSSGSTVLDFNFGFSVPPSTTVAPLNVLGAATFTGTPVVTVEAGNIPSGTGSYPLMTWATTSGTPPTTVALPPHVTGSLVVSGNTLYLNVTSTEPIRWTGSAGNGLWDIATSQNWDDNTATPTDYLQTSLAGDSVVLDETYITASQAITLNSSVIPESVTVNNTIYNYTISGTGSIAGSGNLTKMGGGTLTLDGANTYTGGTLNGGGSTLVIGGAGTITAAGKITNNGTFYYNSTAAATLSGVISGNGNLLVNSAPGDTLTLSGANTYTGFTAITNGVLQITADSNLGAAPGSAVANQLTLNGGATSNNGLRANASFTLNANRGITLGANGGAIQVAGTNIFTYNGVISGSGNFYAGPNFNTGSGTNILGGNSTYSGSTTIACGTLQLGVNGALPSGTPVVVASTTGGGILNLNSFSQTIGTLSSSPGIGGTGTSIPTIELGTSGALTINEAGSSTFAGTITGGASSGVTLNGGSYALTLMGTNTYSGHTTISSGELIGVTGSSVSNSVVTVSGGATNGVSIINSANQWTCGGLTCSSSSAVLDFNFGSSVTPSATVAPLNVHGAATFTGTPIVTVEAVRLPSGIGSYPLMTWTTTSGTPPTTAILPSRVTGSLVVSGNTLYLNATNTEPLRWTGTAGNGLWDIATSQNWDDNTGTPTDYLETTLPGDAVVLDEKYITASTAITLNTVVTPASVTVSNTIYNYSISGTGGITGSIGLTKLGSGTLTLACTNTYTGSTTNLGGTVVVGADNNLGTAPASATVSSIVLSNSTLSATSTFTLNANRGVTMLAGSTLDVASGSQVTYTGIIAGPANLTKTSPGTLVLGGNNNSYNGNTIIASGIVQTGGDHNTGGTASDLGLTPATFAPTNITLAGGTLQGNNADFSFNTNRGIVLLANSGLSALNGDIMGIPGTISGSSSLTISNVGNGIVFLTGTNTYSGSTLISLGLLSLQAGGSLSNSSMSIATGAGFDVSRLASTSYTMGGSAFTASGNGTVTNIGTATAAVINGAAGGTVSLGSLPVFLTFTPAAFAGDSTHPSLYLTQGALQLNGNAFTVNNASGTALGAGTYALIAQNGGAISTSGSPTVNVTGSGIVTGNTTSISVSGTNVNLVVTWQPPTIANPALTTNAPAGVAWKIAITNLAIAADWSDPEGNPVTLSSVGPTSTNGTSVTTDGTYIYYNGTVTVADQFGYVVTDGVLTSSGNVNLVPVNPTGPSINNPGITINGNPTFSGNGIPGYVYGVESETSLTGPWIEAGNTTVGSNGTWTFTDVNQTNPPTIFYRLYYPDNPSNPPQ